MNRDVLSMEAIVEMISLSGLLASARTSDRRKKALIPRSGDGAIAAAALSTGVNIKGAASVDVVEGSAGMASLYRKSLTRVMNETSTHSTFNLVHHKDFLELSPEDPGIYDAVLIVTPPDRDDLAISYIRHSFSFLSPGGVLVAATDMSVVNAKRTADRFTGQSRRISRPDGDDGIVIFKVVK